MARRACSKPHKPGPQARALERMRLLYEEGGYLDEFEELKQYSHFDELSDDEWSAVWRHVLAASNECPSADESRLRFLVDGAAYSSGWFFGFKIHSGPKRSDLKTWTAEASAFLKRVRDFRGAATKFFGEPDEDPTEPYDPWPQRWILAHLDNLALAVESHIRRETIELKQSPPDQPNSLKPELDLWRARLMLAWSETCGLSTKNSKHLRGFLLDAQRPYLTAGAPELLTDRMARHFLERWNGGEIPKPDTSLWVLLHDARSDNLKKG